MDDLNALQAGENVGMLHVSCTDLQALLMGTLDKAMETLKMLLTVAAHKEVGRVLDNFSSLTRCGLGWGVGGDVGEVRGRQGRINVARLRSC